MPNKTTPNKTLLTKEDLNLIFSLLGIILIGLAVRASAAWRAPFPLNDGGLFYAMLRDLQANNYALPGFAHYNGIDIPFAYPPLGFYLTALLADLLQTDLLAVMRWLPPLVSTMTIPAFFLLARKLTPSKWSAALGTLFFALTPSSFAWTIMGGGVTRSFGYLFELLTLTCILQLFTSPQKRFIFLTSACAALTVATHPEAAAQTALAALVFFLFFGRSRAGMIRAGLVATLTILITSPWWGLVLARHGIEPYLAAASAVHADTASWLLRPFFLFKFQVTDEPFLQIVAVLGLIGMFVRPAKQDGFLAVWLALAFLYEPRSAPQTIAIPLGILAANAVTGLILPALQQASRRIAIPVFFILLLLYTYTSASMVAANIATDISLKPSDLEAMQWAQANTPPGSVFLILTGEQHLRDAVSEWFPALTQRVSAATIFGYEWVGDKDFGERVKAYDELQTCARQDETCLDDFATKNDISFAYVYLSSRNGPERFALGPHLLQNPEYELVFSNERSMIFSRSK